MSEKSLCGMGNPLLDIQATVAAGYLDRYQLDSNNQILAEEKHVPMYKELISWFPVDYLPGGATLNTIRIAKWMLNESGGAVYSGAIGEDDFAETLKEQVAKCKLETSFFVQSDLPTGTCAALVSGQGHRSLVANLAAANTYKASHLDIPENWGKITSCQIFYSAGFFLTPPEGPDAMEKVASHAAENNKIYSINLSAPFICQFFKTQLARLMPYCDYIFGNETEAATYAENHGLSADTPIEEIAKHISKLDKINKSRPRTVVFTQGAEQTVVAIGDEVQVFPVTKADKLVDTNGAGDAFVAGFLSQLLLGKDLVDCVNAGHWSAGVIIQHVGCTFPEECTFRK
jgi:adenosine kinase